MGNDGGVIAVKRYLILTKDVEGGDRAKEFTQEVRAARHAACALSGEALGAHVVADELGNLFNKDAVITYLLEKRNVPQFAHIRSLRRDVVDVRATRVQAGGAEESAVEAASGKLTGSSITLSVRPAFVCPLSGLEASGRHAFLVLRSCGCLLSERGVKEMSGGGAGAACPACGASGGAGEGAIKVAPPEEEVAHLRARLEARAGGGKGGKGKRAREGGEEDEGAVKREKTSAKPTGHVPRASTELTAAVSAAVSTAKAASSSYAGLFHANGSIY
jgi:hypothetical protein